MAIKVILPERANRPAFIRRFEAEAQLVARLEHPYIVPLYDYWRDPQGAYLVMRYLRGGSLNQLLEPGPVSSERAAIILDQISAALHVAHRNKVVHRDIKPDNILLDEDENTYLSDFGIAKSLDVDSQSEPNAAGTLRYMSPEQIQGHKVSPQSDIYSLGILLYEMLAGEHPFKDSSVSDLIINHIRNPLPDIRDLLPKLPSEVNDVIRLATAKEAARRFADVREMTRAFRDTLTTGQISLAPVADDATTIASVELANPYKGLQAFQEADADDFYGREALTERLLDRLREAHEFSRFLAVVGPSGSGKSSVVKAGLIPALRRGDIPGSDTWYIVDMLPSDRP